MRAIWLIYLEILREILLGHAEILVFKLLYAALQSSVLISQLDELCIHLVYRGDLWRYILETTALAKFAILRVAPLHDIFDLGRN